MSAVRCAQVSPERRDSAQYHETLTAILRETQQSERSSFLRSTDFGSPHASWPRSDRLSTEASIDGNCRVQMASRSNAHVHMATVMEQG